MRRDPVPERQAASSEAYVPATHDIAKLREAAMRCRGCELWRRGTQTVFGEGPRRAELLLVGEQPGDVEDRAGRPFVGPAGRLLDEALVAAGIERGRVWLTNAVKHFKWEARGKRRIHARPTSREIAACRPWLDAELAAVRPRLVLALGATAAQSLLGPKFRLTQHRGEVLPLPLARDSPGYVMATVHPAAILRAPDSASRRREKARFIEDLRAVVAWRPTVAGARIQLPTERRSRSRRPATRPRAPPTAAARPSSAPGLRARPSRRDGHRR